MPLCQSEQELRVLQGMQQRSTAATKQTLLGAVMRQCWQQEPRREEGLVREGRERWGQPRQAGVHQCACLLVMGLAANMKLQSKKAVLAGTRPDPKTAFKHLFSI